MLRLRERGIRDLAVLRAMEAVPRAAFVPPGHAGLASRDVALPIGCGQSVPDPLFVARLLVGSQLAPEMRVLLIGLEAGYVAAVLAHLVREVVVVDRYKSLVAEAQARLRVQDIANVTALWADGLDLPAQAPFDRLLVMARLDTLPTHLWTLVKEGGAAIHGKAGSFDRHGRERQMLVRADRPIDGIGRTLVIGPSRLAPLRSGLAKRL